MSNKESTGRAAVFLDRDGTIIDDVHYIARPELVRLRSGAAQAIARLNQARVPVIVVTNQSGIARGLYTEKDYLTLTAHMEERLRAQGVSLDAVEYCPHLTDAPVERYRVDCECRKPKPGMLRNAIAALDIDSQASLLVGDRLSDLEAGRAAAIGRCFLVRTGCPLPGEAVVRADGVYDDLLSCVRAVLPPQ